MRDVTLMQAQWKAVTDTGESLSFQNSKGGYFSTADDYGLKVIGKTQGVKAGTKITCCGKNLLDRETGFASNYLKAETPVSAYNGTAMFSNTDKSYLKASHTYTISYDVECLSVPEYTTVYGDQVGFALRTNDFSNTIKLCINRVLSAGDKFSVAVTFTLPDNFVPTDYSMFYYTNSLINNGRYLNPSVIFRNVQIEESETATEFEPYNGNDIILPCDLYEGDMWYPMTGKVIRANNTFEYFTTQPMFMPKGTVNIMQTPTESAGDLSATVLVRR